MWGFFLGCVIKWLDDYVCEHIYYLIVLNEA